MTNLPESHPKTSRSQSTTTSVCLVIVLLVVVGFLQSTQDVGQLVEMRRSQIASLTLPFDEKQDTNTTQVKMTSFLQQLTPTCEDPSSTCNIPNWMKEYFRWHRETLSNITHRSDWMEQKILVLQCLDGDGCGGTADRLRPLPFYLAVAAASNRLFFIRWSKPLPLEDLVEPFQLNWSMPKALARLVDEEKRTVVKTRNLGLLPDMAQDNDIWTLQTLSQLMDYRQQYELVVSSSLEDASSEQPVSKPADYFHDLFLALFRSVPCLLNMIDETMQQLNLIPNEYMVAHIRSLYPKHPYAVSGNIHDLEPAVWNAVDCASYVLAGAPVFVAGDALAVKQIAQEYGRSNRTTARVVSDLDLVREAKEDFTVDNAEYKGTTNDGALVANPLHLDESDEKDPSAYYSIFHDLFFMSQSRCVSTGAGGYGRFGAEASFNPSCVVQHTKRHRGEIITCRPPGN